MKTPPVEGWEPAKITYPVLIPTLDGEAVAETIEIELDAWKNVDGEVFLDGDAHEKIQATKSRHMGLLTPDEIKEIRVSKLNATQKQISSWLQIGEKTWTRWESGRERPSRSMNVILCALRDGKIAANYLESLKLGRSLGRLWQGDFVPVANQPIRYRIPKPAAQSIQRSIDFVIRTGDLEPMYAVETQRSAKFLLDTSVVVHFAAWAKLHSQDSPWCAALRQSVSDTRQPRRNLRQTGLAALLSS